METTAIYIPAELCSAQGTFPSSSHRSICEPSKASRADIIIIIPISQEGVGCPRGGAGICILTIRPRDLPRIPKTHN